MHAVRVRVRVHVYVRMVHVHTHMYVHALRCSAHFNVLFHSINFTKELPFRQNDVGMFGNIELFPPSIYLIRIFEFLKINFCWFFFCHLKIILAIICNWFEYKAQGEK